MIRIELTPAEAGRLREILEFYLSDLRMEIAATEQKDFRDDLKDTKVFLQDLLDRLPRGV